MVTIYPAFKKWAKDNVDTDWVSLMAALIFGAGGIYLEMKTNDNSVDIKSFKSLANDITNEIGELKKQNEILTAMLQNSNRQIEINKSMLDRYINVDEIDKKAEIYKLSGLVLSINNKIIYSELNRDTTYPFSTDEKLFKELGEIIQQNTNNRFLIAQPKLFSLINQLRMMVVSQEDFIKNKANIDYTDIINENRFYRTVRDLSDSITKECNSIKH